MRDADASVECKHIWSEHLDSYCCARLCILCGEHQGLARCFCGWSRSGGDGRRELEDMGEVIEDE